MCDLSAQLFTVVAAATMGLHSLVETIATMQIVEHLARYNDQLARLDPSAANLQEMAGAMRV